MTTQFKNKAERWIKKNVPYLRWNNAECNITRAFAEFLDKEILELEKPQQNKLLEIIKKADNDFLDRESEEKCGACDEVLENGKCPAKCGACNPPPREEPQKNINPLRQNCYNRLKDRQLKDLADKVNELVKRFNTLLEDRGRK